MEKDITQSTDRAYDTQLQGNQIRLLHIVKSYENDARALVICTQKIIDLDIKPVPEYFAISYACGGAYSKEIRDDEGRLTLLDDWIEQDEESVLKVSDFLLICDGIALHIRSNAFVALMTFDLEATKKWVWIDAMCIRQDDASEKAIQIPLMSKIFSRSTETLIHLGHERRLVYGTTNEVFDLIESFKKAFESACTEKRIDKSLINSQSIWKMDFEEQMQIEDLTRKMSLLAEFCAKCRWFRRLWCLQEVALAKIPILRCGRRRINWDVLSILLELLQKYQWMRSLETDSEISSVIGDIDCFESVFMMAYARKTFQGIRLRDGEQVLTQSREAVATSHSSHDHLQSQSEKSVDNDLDLQRHDDERIYLLMGLLELASFNCTIDHDRVYGLFGVLQVFPQYCISSHISISYSKAIEEVYSDVWVSLLLRSENLDLISLQLPCGRRSHWPSSWLIDLRVSSCNNYICHLSTRRLYCASKGIRAMGSDIDPTKRPFEINQTKIRVLGVRFDVVINVIDFGAGGELQILKRVSKLLPRLAPDKRYLRLIWQTLLRISLCDEAGEWTFYLFLLYRSTVQARKERLTGGLLDLHHERMATTLNLFNHDDRSNLNNFLTLHIRILHSSAPNLETNDELYPLWTTINQAAHSFVSNIRCYPPYRQIGITQRGLIGDFPLGTSPGDEIWPLDGASAPMLLRSTFKEDEYLFVGDIWLADFMNGEMLDEQYIVRSQVRHISIV